MAIEESKQGLTPNHEVQNGLAAVLLSEMGITKHNFNHKKGISCDSETVPVDCTGSNDVAGFSDDNVREKWSRNIEFLLSCIALSVGFGNVWRFPYVALKNGGGAFVIPYLIVLFVVGKPLYYLEMVLGQFSSRGCVKVFDACPMMRGIGVGQSIVMVTIMGYYAAILSLAVRYFVDSFQSPLPWSQCQPDWSDCVDARSIRLANGTHAVSSAELYFTKNIMKTIPNIDNGIGFPDWKLALCLLACWICITIMLLKGIRSSGKAAYVLAIFPYVILFILLVRSCTLPGAVDGFKYFIQPQWEKLIDPNVWYEAVSQCFFSLTIGLGAVIVYSSFNSFSHNIYRDAMVISWLDTFTSMISGVIVFGVVGNLAHITQRNVTDVMNAGPQLIFVTYPDAMAKMDFAPNFLAVMFFLMFILLGLGSITGVVTTVMTSIKDRYLHVQTWKVVTVIAVFAFSVGLVYITPGGFQVLDVVEYHGVTFAALTLVILEVITFCWIYGVNRLCVDVEFMLGIKTGIYWRVCWGFLTLFIITAIFILEANKYELKKVPLGYNVFGWCLYAFTVLQVVGWAGYTIIRRPEKRVSGKIINALKPAENWGPESSTLKRDYNVAVRRFKDSTSGGKHIAARVYQRLFK